MSQKIPDPPGWLKLVAGGLVVAASVAAGGGHSFTVPAPPTTSCVSTSY